MPEECMLLEPTAPYFDQIMAYRDAFIARGDSLDGTSNIRKYENLSDWLAFLQSLRTRETLPNGCVPATQYLCVRKRDHLVVGMVNIRHELNDYLLRFGGHIGYSVLPSERRKGYATLQLHLALEKCRALGIPRVLITCSKENEASRRTILSQGGVFDNEVFDENDNEWTQRYWIQL